MWKPVSVLAVGLVLASAAAVVVAAASAGPPRCLPPMPMTFPLVNHVDHSKRTDGTTDAGGVYDSFTAPRCLASAARQEVRMCRKRGVNVVRWYTAVIAD